MGLDGTYLAAEETVTLRGMVTIPDNWDGRRVFLALEIGRAETLVYSMRQGLRGATCVPLAGTGPDLGCRHRRSRSQAVPRVPDGPGSFVSLNRGPLLKEACTNGFRRTIWDGRG